MLWTLSGWVVYYFMCSVVLLHCILTAIMYILCSMTLYRIISHCVLHHIAWFHILSCRIRSCWYQSFDHFHFLSITGTGWCTRKIEKFIRWLDSPQFFSVIWFWHFLRRIFIDLCVHMSWSTSASNCLSVVSCHPLLLFSSVLLLSLTAFPNTNRFLLDSSSPLLFSPLLFSSHLTYPLLSSFSLTI